MCRVSPLFFLLLFFLYIFKLISYLCVLQKGGKEGGREGGREGGQNLLQGQRSSFMCTLRACVRKEIPPSPEPIFFGFFVFSKTKIEVLAIYICVCVRCIVHAFFLSPSLSISRTSALKRRMSLSVLFPASFYPTLLDRGRGRGGDRRRRRRPS